MRSLISKPSSLLLILCLFGASHLHAVQEAVLTAEFQAPVSLQCCINCLSPTGLSFDSESRLRRSPAVQRGQMVRAGTTRCRVKGSSGSTGYRGERQCVRRPNRTPGESQQGQGRASRDRLSIVEGASIEKARRKNGWLADHSLSVPRRSPKYPLGGGQP